jgi:2-haloacid dehalogenase
MSEQPIIVFDVNETLLDLEALQPTFERIFNDPAAMRLWFAGLITYSEALTLANVYVPFTDIGAAVLRMLAATRDITISDADAAELTDRFATMPPHPEVPAALRRLRDHGFRLCTLTDNTLEISGRQLQHGGIIEEFERRFSVDETVRRHKPAQEAYHSVAAALGAASARSRTTSGRTSTRSPTSSSSDTAPCRTPADRRSELGASPLRGAMTPGRSVQRGV